MYLRTLEFFYDLTYYLLRPFRRWLKPAGRVESIMILGEEVAKGALFGCRMCGQCILHSTGMTCPMNCPKQLRNGPCGGVRSNGHCEVKPEMRCVWVQAFERSRELPSHGRELLQIQPPVDRRFARSSSWINMLHGIDSEIPAGWANTPDIPVIPLESKKDREEIWAWVSSRTAD